MKEWRSILTDAPSEGELIEVSKDGDSVLASIYWNSEDCADLTATHWRPTLSDFDEYILAKDPVLARLHFAMMKDGKPREGESTIEAMLRVAEAEFTKDFGVPVMKENRPSPPGDNFGDPS